MNEEIERGKMDGISIKGFNLTKWPNGVLFLSLNDGPHEGEGTQVDEELLRECLQRFYDDNF